MCVKKVSGAVDDWEEAYSPIIQSGPKYSLKITAQSNEQRMYKAPAIARC